MNTYDRLLELRVFFNSIEYIAQPRRSNEEVLSMEESLIIDRVSLILLP